MINVLIFLATTVVYSAVWFALTGMPQSLTDGVYSVAFIALLSLPLNIDGHVFTVIGNGVAEKNIISLISLFQKAKCGSATAVLGVGFQQANGDRGLCCVACGPAICQLSDRCAFIFIGVVFYQKAKDAIMGLGFSGFQRSTYADVGLGVVGWQEADYNCKVGIGFACFQHAGDKAGIGAGLALCQSVEGKTRAFTVFSTLSKENI